MIAVGKQNAYSKYEKRACLQMESQTLMRR